MLTEELCIGLWTRAKLSTVGIGIEILDKADLFNARNLLYQCRLKMEDPDLDDFSVVLPKDTGEVWLIRKDIADARPI